MRFNEFFTEREIGRAFKLELENKKFIILDKQRQHYTTRFKVYLNKPVQTNKRKFVEFWKSKNLDLKHIPPSQPEIDMTLVDEIGIWRAIELKAIKKRRERPKKGLSARFLLLIMLDLDKLLPIYLTVLMKLLFGNVLMLIQ